MSRWLWLVSTLLLSSACGDARLSEGGTPLPTLVAVDPVDFLERDGCAAGEGAPRSYVATLTELTAAADAGAQPPAQEQRLLSSGPIDCHRGVGFSFVTPYARYVAEIQTYDRAPTELRPEQAGGASMLDLAGERVAPLQVIDCGRVGATPSSDGGGVEDGVYARPTATVFVRPCAPRPAASAP